jgi:hypothetical protein
MSLQSNSKNIDEVRISTYLCSGIGVHIWTHGHEQQAYEMVRFSFISHSFKAQRKAHVPKAQKRFTKTNPSKRPQMLMILASGSLETPPTILASTPVVVVNP